MEDIIGYIILFALGLGALYLYQWRKDKIRILPVSDQHYQELRLMIFIRRQHGEIQNLIFRVSAKKDIIIQDILVEMISSKQETTSLSLKHLLEDSGFPVHISSGKSSDFEVTMEKFRTEITRQSQQFNTFRLVAETIKGKKFKSHRLAFSKYWSVFKPDSGKYN
ncbi:MAG TPA: hypothetical protein ENH02_01340 [Bacteroidetes bacterium]|nr:hypothetical protein [Bacteroidota bacterium]